MMKKIFCLLCALVFLASLIPIAHADRIPSRDDLYVVFTAEEKMESNFLTDGAAFTEMASELQPGDYILYYIEMRNDHSLDTEWYMKNEVVNSLERAANTARGGAYTYILTYTSPAGVTEEFFNSATVGGSSDNKDATEGLIEATNGLKEYFYVDRLKGGERALITLYVELDGETQGNDYQDTLADLKMQFAVELLEEGAPPPNNPREEIDPSPRPHVIVRTGDDTNLKGLYTMMIVSGTLGGLSALLLALDGIRRRRKEAGRA